MSKILLLIPLFFLIGCINFDYGTKSFKEGKQINLEKADYRFDFVRGEYSIKGEMIYITDVVRYLESRVCVVYSSDLKNVPFSINVQNVSMAELMKSVSSSLDANIQNMGRLWILTKKDKKNDSVTSINGTSVNAIEYTYFFNVVGYSDREVLENLGIFQIKKIGNGFYCFRGSLMDAISLDDILCEMLINQPVQYYFTVWFVSEDILRDFSMKLNGKMEFSAEKVLGDVSSDRQWSLVLDALGSSNIDMSNTDMVRKVGGVVREGGEFVLNVGDEVPIPKRTVSDGGTVTDTGYEYQNTGLMLRIKCEGKSRGVLELDLENTDISGYVGSYPIKHGSKLQTILIVSDAKRSYVGSCQMTSKSKGLWGWNKRSTKYHIWLQCDLVGYGQRVSTEFTDY